MPTAPELPAWVEYLKAFSVPAIGVLAGAIAFWQARIAHQKVLVDLFDRRLALVSDASAAVSQAIQKFKIEMPDLRGMYVAKAKAQFLFGPEISEFLGTTIERMADIGLCDAKMSDGQHHELAARKTEHWTVLLDFEVHLSTLCLPYMTLHHRGGEWPWNYWRRELRKGAKA